MRYLTYLLISVLIAATVCQCGGIRNTATRIRTRRTEELESI